MWERREKKNLPRGTGGFSFCFEAQVGAGPKTVGGRIDPVPASGIPVHAPAGRSYFFLVVFLAVDFLAVDFLAAAFLAMALYLLS